MCKRLHAVVDVTPVPLTTLSISFVILAFRMSGCDIFAGRRACTCFFLLVEAPRGAYSENLQVKQGFTGAFKRLSPVRMSIYGNGEGTGKGSSASSQGGGELVWYQCAKAFRGFK